MWWMVGSRWRVQNRCNRSYIDASLESSRGSFFIVAFLSRKAGKKRHDADTRVLYTRLLREDSQDILGAEFDQDLEP